MQIKLLIDAGGMKPGPALSQKLGPTGINVNQVITKVNEATKKFEGMKVPVEVDIDVATKNIEVKVSSPPASGLLKKEAGIDKGSGIPSKTKVGNISIEQIISVAKSKFPNLLSRTLKTAVKEIVGTCVSLGILVENKSPMEIQLEIDAGKYDKEISSERTETSAEKKAKLDKFFADVKAVQEKIKQQEEAAKAAAEAAALAAGTATATPTATAAAPGTPATTTTAATAPAAATAAAGKASAKAASKKEEKPAKEKKK
ncbi:MAG: 50S ribosomal protein L11 [Candidatus Nanoarchaeia archaeon]|nr:50S ribosomal protein L11 [Candidatus Nanoarchaeia archaeon]